MHVTFDASHPFDPDRPRSTFRRSTALTRLFAGLILAVGFLIPLVTPGSAVEMQLSINPTAGPSGTSVQISGRSPEDTTLIRVFAEIWMVDSQCGIITDPMLIAEVQLTGMGEFETTFQAIRASDAVAGITIYAWDPINQVRSDLKCFTFEDTPGAEYFPVTGYWVTGNFLSYWNRFGGLAIFGYPLTAEYVDPDSGISTQWFERARFEWHPGAWPERFDVLLGLLGNDLTRFRREDPAFRPVVAGDDANCTYYEQTGHRLCFGFRRYWEQYGGLPIFGYPISEEFREVNPDLGIEYTVQYFERGRFEWHPGEWPERYDVMLGRLGAELVPSDLTHTAPTP
jgi:hypothetical protein